MKKFKLTSNTVVNYGRKFTQIESVCDFNDVTRGDLGGWVEDESSLKNDAWVYKDVFVFAGAEIRGGEIRGGVILGGVIRGGVILGGVIRGGVIRGGEIRGGEIRGGEIRGDNHIGFANVGSEKGYLLAYIMDNEITISRGCFYGNIDEFYDKVESHHGDNEYGQFYKALRPIIEMKLKKFLEVE